MAGQPKGRFLVLPLLLLFSIAVFAVSHRSITVGYYKDPGQPGVSQSLLAVWQETAKTLKQPYTLLSVHSAADGLTALRQKQIQLFIGPFHPSNTHFGISYIDSYVPNSIGVAISEAQHGNVFSTVSDYLKVIFGVTFLGIIIVMVIMGTIFWLLESRRNSEKFPRNPLKGIGEGIWYCLVTFTTVGYGDIIPKTLWGRLLAMFWMIVSMFLFSAFIATVSSELTVAKSHSAAVFTLSHLKHARISYVSPNSRIYRFIHHIGGKPVARKNLVVALSDLTAGRSAVVMANYLVLKQYLNNHPSAQILLVDKQFDAVTYPFAILSSSHIDQTMPRVLYSAFTSGSTDNAILSVIAPRGV